MWHFTFPDAALGYDCVTCGARCCKGLGFAFTAAELVPLLGRAPTLAPFLQLTSRAVSAFDLADGCWQLSLDGRCGLEVAAGREAKPSMCRLFPLRILALPGGGRVADLQLAACPLEPAPMPAGPGRTVLRHAQLLAELAELGGDLPSIEAALPPGAPDDALAREASIRDAASARAAGASDLFGALAGAHDLDAGAFAPLEGGWLRAYAVSPDEWRALAAQVARPFLLALGPLRMAELTTPGAPPWPKCSRALPANLAAGAFLAALSVRAGRPPTVRAIAEVWRSTPLLRRALAGWLRPAALADAPAPASAPPELGRAFEAVRDALAHHPLGEALLAAELPEPLRPLLLRLVSDRLRPHPGGGGGH